MPEATSRKERQAVLQKDMTTQLHRRFNRSARRRTQADLDHLTFEVAEFLYRNTPHAGSETIVIYRDGAMITFSSPAPGQTTVSFERFGVLLDAQADHTGVRLTVDPDEIFGWIVWLTTNDEFESDV